MYRCLEHVVQYEVLLSVLLLSLLQCRRNICLRPKHLNALLLLQRLCTWERTRRLHKACRLHKRNRRMRRHKHWLRSLRWLRCAQAVVSQTALLDMAAAAAAAGRNQTRVSTRCLLLQDYVFCHLDRHIAACSRPVGTKLLNLTSPPNTARNAGGFKDHLAIFPR